MKRILMTMPMAMWIASASAVQYVTNDTVVVDSELKEGLDMNGGRIEYRYSPSRFLRSAILLSGGAGTETVYDVSGYGGQTPLSFQKDILSNAGAKLALPCDVEFGAVSSAYNAGYHDMSSTTFGYDFWTDAANMRSVGYSGFPYVAPDAIRFAENGAKLILSGHVALTAWPDFPYEITAAAPGVDADTAIAFLGENMAAGETFELTGYNVVWANLNAFSPDTTVVVPSNRYLIALHEGINATPTRLNAVTPYLTCTPSGNTFTNDVRLAGGTFVVAEQGAWYHYGEISGTGTIVMEAAAARDGVIRAFRGSLDDFDGQLKVYSGAGAARMDGRQQNVYLSKTFSEGHGDLYLYASTNCLTCMSFSPAQGQAGNWYVGKVKSEGVYVGASAKNGALAGAAWNLLPSQHLTIGALEGGIAVIGKANSTLTVGRIADGSSLYFTNGVPLTVTDSLGAGIRIAYGDNASGEDALTFPQGGGMVEELELHGNTVRLAGTLEIGRVVGSGKLVVVDGDVRIGATGSNVEVEVSEGAKVAFSGAGRLPEVVSDPRLTLWLDASDLTSYRGVPSTADSRSSYAEWREVVTALGSKGLVYTNDFPLVDQWYDCRADRRPSVGADGYDASAYSQGKFYFYNDRMVRNGDTWPYPQFMPYVMTNQVNGKSVLSFDSPGATLDRTWAAKVSGTVNVRRSMSLVYGAQRVYTAIMVFGSQDGGGRSVLGGYSQSAYGTTNDYTRSACSPYYTRGGAAADRGDPSTAVFASDRQTWLDGIEVDPRSTGFSGGYQVLSFDGKANYFRSLGYNQSFPADGTECGGARYGEILIFGGTASESNPLTAAQRETVECYLAQKWGITDYRSPIMGRITLSGGTAKTLGNYAPAGEGTWEVETDTVVGPGFAGTLSGKGNVRVADGIAMPRIDAGFTGVVSVATNVLSFTMTSQGVADASTASGASFEFPKDMIVEIRSETTRIPTGEHVLVSGASIAGLETAELHDLTRCSNRVLKLVKRDRQLMLDVRSLGMVMTVR